MSIKRIYGCFLITLSRIAGKDLAKTFDAYLRFGRKLDLKSPKTLADKVVYIENHFPNNITSRYTDKWEVRDYLVSKGLEKLLVPVYGDVYSCFDDIPFETFPQKFVLKATHGCKMNYFCADHANFDKKKCRRIVEKWLNSTYGGYSGEWHYLDIPHRVYCEQYLEDAEKMIDYKIHCLNGEPEFVQVISERDTTGSHMRDKQNLYDLSWRELAGLTGDVGSGVQKPDNLEEMIKVARILSSDFKYVRVDLYEIHGKLLFGELTFTPANGVFPHFTNEFLEKLGAKLVI